MLLKTQFSTNGSFNKQKINSKLLPLKNFLDKFLAKYKIRIFFLKQKSFYFLKIQFLQTDGRETLHQYSFWAACIQGPSLTCTPPVCVCGGAISQGVTGQCCSA